jgi:DNA-binding transcriptional MerR regulator
MNGLTIGKMAKKAGVTNDTIRFYERCGLINPAGRSESNYRIYHEEDAARLRFIKRAKELGFSLNEIKDLLALSHDPDAAKAEVKARTEEKAENIRQKINDLSKILTALEHFVSIYVRKPAQSSLIASRGSCLASRMTGIAAPIRHTPTPTSIAIMLYITFCHEKEA